MTSWEPVSFSRRTLHHGVWSMMFYSSSIRTHWSPGCLAISIDSEDHQIFHSQVLMWEEACIGWDSLWGCGNVESGGWGSSVLREYATSFLRVAAFSPQEGSLHVLSRCWYLLLIQHSRTTRCWETFVPEVLDFFLFSKMSRLAMGPS